MNASCCTLRPRATPSPEEHSLLGVMHGDYCGLTHMPQPRRGRGVALPFAQVRRRSGGFLHSCINHVEGDNTADWEAYTVGGVTMRDAVAAWHGLVAAAGGAPPVRALYLSAPFLCSGGKCRLCVLGRR